MNKEIQLSQQEKDTLKEFDLSIVIERLECYLPLTVHMVKKLSCLSSDRQINMTDRCVLKAVLRRWEDSGLGAIK